ncbi:MAG: hypothetical protein V1928_03605 [Parcubacteria group bacterium]
MNDENYFGHLAERRTSPEKKSSSLDWLMRKMFFRFCALMVVMIVFAYCCGTYGVRKEIFYPVFGLYVIYMLIALVSYFKKMVKGS